ncbi:MAG: large conductance mechanosensitive channel protein MscL, partial [Calditrichia bacterium]
MIQEFKKFALKGNMLDMAVGIIIGAAFATVIKSLVDDVLMPIVAAVFNTPDFSNLFVILRNPTGEVFTSIEAARAAGAAALGYGLFINALIAFTIVAFVLFL